MTLRPQIVGAGLLSVCALFLAGSAHAQVANGGFETGNLTGWVSSGFTAVEQSKVNPTSDGHYASFQINPTQGTYLALAGTDHFGGITPNPATTAALETFLSLPGGTLNTIANPDTAFEGSAFKQTFHASAGDIVSFDWDFATSETSAPINNDFGFYTLNGTAIKLADTNSTLSAIPGSLTAPYDQHTGFSTRTFMIPTNGSYTLGFGAVNANDDNISSALLVDNVHIGAGGGGGTPAVPEPGSVALLFGAGIGSLLLKRKMKNRS